MQALARPVIDSLREENERLKETIKGLDRRNAEYMKEIALLKTVGEWRKITIQERDERIAYLLEADAGRPVLNVNGTIEALHGLVAKLKGDVLKLQAKVTEQEDTISSYMDDDHRDAQEN